MGVSELQVFVSLVVILGAAFVALICDFLKGNNERLRESNIELRVRQDERERREAHIDRAHARTLEAVAHGRRLALRAQRKRRATPAPAIDEAQPQPARRSRERRRNASWVEDYMMRYGENAPVAPAEPEAPAPPWHEEPGEVVRIRVLAEGELIPEVENFTPRGIQQPAALARLLEEARPFHGLAVVLSLVDYPRLLSEQDQNSLEKLMASIERLAASMTRDQDFVCRIADDEFALIFADETGPAARIRVQKISESLWDFQLRSMGSVSIIFSWGAVESSGRGLAHCLEEARERMLETRRTRRSAGNGGGRAHQWAATGD